MGWRTRHGVIPCHAPGEARSWNNKHRGAAGAVPGHAGQREEALPPTTCRSRLMAARPMAVQRPLAPARASPSSTTSAVNPIACRHSCAPPQKTRQPASPVACRTHPMSAPLQRLPPPYMDADMRDFLACCMTEETFKHRVTSGLRKPAPFVIAGAFWPFQQFLSDQASQSRPQMRPGNVGTRRVRNEGCESAWATVT